MYPRPGRCSAFTKPTWTSPASTEPDLGAVVADCPAWLVADMVFVGLVWASERANLEVDQ